MASEFYDKISKDERKDWRQSHVTQLAIKMLRGYEQEAARVILEGSSERSATETAYKLGIRFAIKECIELLEKE